MSAAIEVAEKALLEGEWADDIQPNEAWAFKFARNVAKGDFRDLTAPSARSLFQITATNEEALEKPLADWFQFSGGGSVEDELLRLTSAVACLHAFVQSNWTGPDLDFKPLDVLLVPTELSGAITEDLLHQKSVAELAYGGEPAYHLARHPIFLVLAKLLLAEPFQHLRSGPWWQLRAWLVHEQVLDEPVIVAPELLPAIEPLLADATSHSEAEAAAPAFASEPDFAGRLLLERGLLDHYVGDDKSAAEYFVRAARATRLEYELTGALGKRTRFQQTDVTQLVLLAESRARGGEPATSTSTSAADTAAGAGGEGPSIPPPDRAPEVEIGDTETAAATAAQDKTPIPVAAAEPSAPIPETLALNDDTLLEHTEFTSSAGPATSTGRLEHIDPAAQPALHPLDQCILLALCLNVRNTSPAHGLTAEQMAPYVARVLSHPRNWSVHTMALLLRARLEAGRTRTVERATLQLQALVDQMPTADSSAAERLRYVHALALPSRWEMEGELARRFLSIGVVKSALAVFERLELWEDVVRCWQALEQREKGLAVVRDLLAGRKVEADVVLTRGKAVRRRGLDAAREAKLWCLLGDLEPERAVEHYTKAWEVSGASSGRAMRSLGGLHFARDEYAEAIECLRRAVAINPLLARSWFVLGCACVRTEDWAGARDAFVRCVTIEDEDAESWNNLASVYLRMGGSAKAGDAGEDGDGAVTAEAEKKRVPFEHKMLAYRALQQGLKYSYENWRMWNNYMIIALDVGELSEVCRALARVVEERSAKDGAECVDEDVLDRLVDAVTRGPGDAEGNEGAAGLVQGLERRVADLFDLTLLPRVSSPRIFRARARFLTWQKRWEDALNAYLDAYRTGPAGTMEKGETDVERWRGAVGEVEEIVDVLRNFGPRVDGFNWRLQARSIVRTFVGRTKEAFEDEADWDRLAALLEELKKEE